MASETRIVGGTLNVAGLIGPLWFGGWLFTIGYLHLQMPTLLFALALWPYYLGVAIHH